MLSAIFGWTYLLVLIFITCYLLQLIYIELTDD